MSLLLTRVGGQFPGLGTRTLLGILCGLSLISWAITGPGLLLLSPGTLLWRPWTLVTGALTEPNILFLIFSVPLLAVSVRYFEALWGPRELLRFLSVVAPFSSLGLVLCVLLEGSLLLSLEEGWQFETFGGPFPILVAFLVAFKQVVPEHRIILFGMSLASLRTKDAPMLLLSAGSLLYFLEKILFKGTSTVFIVIYYQIFLGVFTAWTYLRFFQYRDGICGDRSETFAFVTFFPEMLHPILRPISNSGFKLMVKLGFCSPTLNRGPLDSPLSGSSESMAPQQPKTSAELDSDRRKALGLRALQMKLSGQNPPAAPP